MTVVGDNSTPWKLTRRNDSDTSSEFTSGELVFVSEGVKNRQIFGK